MSGPKVSAYTLTQAQKAAIIAEQQRRRMELEKRRELLFELKSISALASNKIESLAQFDFIIELSEKYEKDLTIQTRVNSVKKKLSRIQEISTDALHNTETSKLETVLSSCKKILDEVTDDIDSIKSAASQSGQTITDSLSTQIRSFFITQLEKEKTETVEDVQGIIQSLDSVYENPYLPITVKRKLEEMLHRVRTDKSISNAYIQLEVFPLLKECKEFIRLWQKYGKEYQCLCARYETLMEELGDEALEMVPFSEDALMTLKQRIAKAEEQSAMAAEQSYISQALDEVMIEMGYPIWGVREVTKRSGKHFKNELYRYSPTAAVSITYSDDGQITMELGKTDTVDRLPSAEETPLLVDAMNRFCTDFRSIEERLATKGVIVRNRIALLPPSASHAQIINLQDYKTEGLREVGIVKKSTRAKRKTLRAKEY